MKLSGGSMSQSLFAKGNECFRNKEYYKAIDFYKRSAADNSFNYCFLNISHAFYKLGNLNESYSWLMKAIEESESSTKHWLKNESSLYQYLTKSLPKSFFENKSNLPVSELKNKLWGGFSKQAKIDLLNFLKSDIASNKDKVSAAYVLARWYAVNGEWEKTEEFSKKIRQYDPKAYRNKKVKLLLIESYINSGQYDKAKEMIEFVISQKVEGDFLCALNNLLMSSDVANSDVLRLNALNAIYSNAGLEPILLIDSSLGLVFGNLAFNTSSRKIFDGPKISILVPVYNAEEFIDVAIESLLNQTWQNIEVIAVEDCGNDASWSKLQEHAEKDSRLKIFKNDQNLGAYPTRNRALSLATGDFITVHDSDDWSHPQMLEVQMKAMIESPEIKITCSSMTRVYPNLRFILRPQRENLEYIHRSYPSVLIRKEDFELLGEWDGVSANADDEFVQRARQLWGSESVVDIMKQVPFSFFLVHENSLTQQSGTSLNTLTFGIRKEYSRQANYWRRKKAQDIDLKVRRTSLKNPFPIPQGLAPKNWIRNSHYDLVIVTDLSLLGGTRRCNEGYIEAASSMGWRIGIFHWPRYDLKVADIANEYTEFSYRNNIDILVPEDNVSADTVLIHHPPILKYEIDSVPTIDCNKVGILVNQSPMQLWSQDPFYYEAEASEKLVEKLFGHKPVWIPISTRVIQTLNKSGGFNNIYPSIWFPPYNEILPKSVPSLPIGFGTDRKIILGRHARNHWTKWPSTAQDIKQAYCAHSDRVEVHLLGGAQTPLKILGEIPSNWNVLDFDSINVKSFVDSLDFFVHYTHEDYIEEFGRNIMEAMAAGRIVLLPPIFVDVFGNAAIYVKPEEVESTVIKYWNDEALYTEQVRKGFDFVQRKSSLEAVKHNLESFNGTD